MKPWLWWAAWMVCYLIGYALLLWMDAPGWGAVIGGWVMAWGTMGRYREIG